MKHLIQILKPRFNCNTQVLVRFYSANNKTDEFSAAKSDSKEDDAAFDIIGNIPEAEEQMEREQEFRERVERMRDVSRFSRMTAANKHRNKMPTYGDLENASFIKNDPRYFRKLFAKHGRESGVEAGLAWPSMNELNELVRQEKELELSLEQKVKLLIERKLKQISSVEKMEKDTDEALKKMPKQIEALYQRTLKKEEILKEKQAKRQEILDQAREFYGFEVDLRDGRIQEMVKKLQEEKKAAERMKKKEEEKKAKQTNLLQQKLKESEKLIKNLNESSQ